jgi:hypothetical protein
MFFSTPSQIRDASLQIQGRAAKVAADDGRTGPYFGEFGGHRERILLPGSDLSGVGGAVRRAPD